MQPNFQQGFHFQPQIRSIETGFLFSTCSEVAYEALSPFKFSSLSPSPILSLKVSGGVGRRGVHAASSQCRGECKVDVALELFVVELSSSFSGYTLLHFSISLVCFGFYFFSFHICIYIY